MLPMNWPYVAGFFDGEGCLHGIEIGGKGKSRFRITISQTQKEVLDEIAEFLQGQFVDAYVLRHKPKQPKAHWKPCWNVWITKQQSVANFIAGVFPYLRVKKQRAEDYRRLCLMIPRLQGTHAVVYSDGHVSITDPTPDQKQAMRPVNGYAKVNRAEFIAFMESGKSVTEAAKQFGLDYSTANSKAKRLGFHVDSTVESNRKRAKHTLEHIQSVIAEVGSVREAAKQLGLPLANLRVRLMRYGIDPGPSAPRGRAKKISPSSEEHGVQSFERSF